MSLEQKVMSQLKQAMKNKNTAEVRTLRSIKAAIIEARTAANAKREFSEADELKMLQKLAKQRKDALKIYKEQNREDLATIEQEELNVLERFLPKPIAEKELKEKIAEIIKQVDAKSPADMGKVMATATKALSGKAEGSVIAKVTKEMLKN